jgi:hypothetical protein
LYWLGFYPDVIRTILQLTTYKEQLPIGAATSPLLFNLVLHVIDLKIDRYLKSMDRPDIIYTRFFDDLIFSSQKEILLDIRKGIISILAEHGLNIKRKKTFYQDVMKKALQTVGLTITLNGVILSKKCRRNLEGILWLAIRDPLKWKFVIDGKLGLFKMVYGAAHLPKRIDFLVQEFDCAYADAWHKAHSHGG